jgi:hypothetical protein
VNYVGESNEAVQIDCKSATALGCAQYNFHAECGCASGCDTKTKKLVWTANPTLQVGPITVYFSTDCYDTGKIIMEEEKHAAAYDAAIEKGIASQKALAGKTFQTKAACEGACEEWKLALSESMFAPLQTWWINFMHPNKKCDGSFKW